MQKFFRIYAVLICVGVAVSGCDTSRQAGGNYEAEFLSPPMYGPWKVAGVLDVQHCPFAMENISECEIYLARTPVWIEGGDYCAFELLVTAKEIVSDSRSGERRVLATEHAKYYGLGPSVSNIRDCPSIELMGSEYPAANHARPIVPGYVWVTGIENFAQFRAVYQLLEDFWRLCEDELCRGLFRESLAIDILLESKGQLQLAGIDIQKCFGATTARLPEGQPVCYHFASEQADHTISLGVIGNYSMENILAAELFLTLP